MSAAGAKEKVTKEGAKLLDVRETLQRVVHLNHGTMVLVPEFGLPEVKYPYTRDDIREAERTLRRYDDDEDGYIDRDEARYARWTHIPPFHSDLNKDDRLSKMELGQRYARRRLLDDAADELVQKSRRTGSEVRRNEKDRGRSRDEGSQW